MQKRKADNPATPRADNPRIKQRLDEIYKSGFNIYMMLNKLKKDLGRKDDFPDEVIERFCDHYWKHKPANKYPYFLKAFKLVSAQWFADKQIREHKEFKKAGTAISLRDIMRGV